MSLLNYLSFVPRALSSLVPQVHHASCASCIPAIVFHVSFVSRVSYLNCSCASLALCFMYSHTPCISYSTWIFVSRVSCPTYLTILRCFMPNILSSICCLVAFVFCVSCAFSFFYLFEGFPPCNTINN